jgi:hypothetical protein
MDVPKNNHVNAPDDDDPEEEDPKRSPIHCCCNTVIVGTVDRHFWCGGDSVVVVLPRKNGDTDGFCTVMPMP